METAIRTDSLIPNHLGIIMDGNGRWAQERGLPRSAGHQEGANIIRRTSEACIDFGIRVLTLYTFSTENWSRPPEEVEFIMQLLESYAKNELPALQRNGIRLQLMGQRDRLSDSILKALDTTIQKTQDNDRLVLNLALNYGGRTEIIDAAKAILTENRQFPLDERTVDEALIAEHLYCPKCPDVDLIIRTGGEWRLSNFMTWRATHAVFWSTPVYWPDFNRIHLQEGIQIYDKHTSAPHESTS